MSIHNCLRISDLRWLVDQNLVTMFGAQINFFICAYVLYIILVIEYLPASGNEGHNDGCGKKLTKLKTVNSGSYPKQSKVQDVNVRLEDVNDSVNVIILEDIFIKIRAEVEHEIKRQELLRKLRASNRINSLRSK